MVTDGTLDKLVYISKEFPDYIVRIKKHPDSEYRSILITKRGEDRRIVYDKGIVAAEDLQGECDWIITLIEGGLI